MCFGLQSMIKKYLTNVTVVVWFLGSQNTNCISTCTDAGKTCDQDMLRGVDSSTKVQEVAALLGITCAATNLGNLGYEFYPTVIDTTCYYLSDPIAICAETAGASLNIRLCPCI